MLKHPTLTQLHALGLHGMAKAFDELAANGQAEGLDRLVPRDKQDESSASIRMRIAV